MVALLCIPRKKEFEVKSILKPTRAYITTLQQSMYTGRQMYNDPKMCEITWMVIQNSHPFSDEEEIDLIYSENPEEERGS